MYKNYTLRRLGITLIVLFPQVAREPAHKTGVVLCHEKTERPSSTIKNVKNKFDSYKPNISSPLHETDWFFDIL
jgi:hypothetical protein